MRDITIDKVLKVCNGSLYGPRYKNKKKEFTGVTIYADKVETDSLFVAIKRERIDGHSYIPTAFENGCLAVICETLPEKLDGICILVENSVQALKDLAQYYRQSLKAKIIEITGNKGKTGAKEFTTHVLSAQYSVLKMQDTTNVDIDFPLTILKITQEHDIAVLELGMDNIEKMYALSRIAKPDIFVITNIGRCCPEFLENIRNNHQNKTEIFDFMSKGGMICLNGDDEELNTINTKHSIIRYGRNRECDIFATDIENRDLLGTTAAIHIKNAEEQAVMEVNISIPGIHMIDNAMAAVAAGRLLNLDFAQAVQSINSMKALNGRSNVIQSAHYILIDDCNNANPDSMKAAIDLLDTAQNRKVAILGDMFELGENECELHMEIGRYIKTKKIDVVLCVGILAKNMYAGCKGVTIKYCRWFQTKQELMVNVMNIVRDKDTILIKASRGMGFSEIVDLLRNEQ